MAGNEFIFKLVKSEGVYVRTNGTWSGPEGPSLPDWSCIGRAPDNTIFVTTYPTGSGDCDLWERLGPSSWSKVGAGLRVARAAEFYPVSKDEIWFVGSNIASAHAVRWTRSGGQEIESFPGYNPGTGNVRGCCVVLSTGVVLVSIRGLGNMPNRMVWRRTAGPTWTRTLYVSDSVGNSGDGLWAVDDNNVWAGNDLAQYFKSTNGGQTFSGPLTFGAGGGPVGIFGPTDNDIWLARGDMSHWDGNSWTHHTPVGGGGQAQGGIIVNGNVIIDDSGNKNKIYIYNGTSWTEDTVTGAGSGSDISAHGKAVEGYVTDETAPTITLLSPEDEATSVNPENAILVRVSDDTSVDLSTVIITISFDGGDPITVFTGSTFQTGYTNGSSYESNAFNGYDFTILKDD